MKYIFRKYFLKMLGHYAQYRYALILYLVFWHFACIFYFAVFHISTLKFVKICSHPKEKVRVAASRARRNKLALELEELFEAMDRDHDGKVQLVEVTFSCLAALGRIATSIRSLTVQNEERIRHNCACSHWTLFERGKALESCLRKLADIPTIKLFQPDTAGECAVFWKDRYYY